MEEITFNNDAIISELDSGEGIDLQDIDGGVPTDQRFMGANTISVTLRHLKERCTIPVFSKDNESTISHQEFVDLIGQTAALAFPNERISQPAIRVSHVIKGRIPAAVGKPAKDLQEHEKTIYYERLAFLYDLPGICEDVNGNRLSLSLGGVRAYNLENLYGRKSEERFKLFIGFKNHVCTNLCISTDGFLEEVRVRTLSELLKTAMQLFSSFNIDREMNALENLSEYSLTDRQFAQMIGRLRMYPFLKGPEKERIPQLSLGDSQVNSVIRGYYQDKAFRHDLFGGIDLWKLYNLFTGANKSSYIDTFLDRTVGAYSFTCLLFEALKSSKSFWYLGDGE
jgi:hypothetical protein